MAWDPSTEQYTYSAYAEQASASARLTMARQFITEITNDITARTSAVGESFDPQPLLQLREQVQRDIRDWLQPEADAESGVGLPRAVRTVTRDLR